MIGNNIRVTRLNKKLDERQHMSRFFAEKGFVDRIDGANCSHCVPLNYMTQPHKSH